MADERSSAEDLRIPPQNLDAETAVLGGILMDPQAMALVAGVLPVDTFYKPAHNTIYRAMLDMMSEGEPIDTVTLSNKLSKDGCLDNIGGAFYITGLSDTLPSAANIEHYAQIVLATHLQRLYISTYTQSITDLYQGVEAEETLAPIYELSDQFQPKGYQTIEQVADMSLAELREVHEQGRPPGIPTGYYGLDQIAGGFKPKDLIVLAARPSFGKSALAACLAYNMASCGYPTAIASLESSAIEIVNRMLFQRTKISSGYYISGKIQDHHMRQFDREAQRFKGLPLWIDSSGEQRIDAIIARARRLKSQHGLNLLIIDYLQMVSGAKRTENRNTELGEYSRKCKLIAMTLNITVLLLSQLSRAPDKRPAGKQRPVVSDIRESGNIEQDADQIWFLYRPDKYEIDTEPEGRENIIRDAKGDTKAVVVELHVAKHRNGPTGTVNFHFQEKIVLFSGVDYHHQDPVAPPSSSPSPPTENQEDMPW